ncbi:MAG: nickel pincer cofactor biosynthesis protein LarC [Deltaproteobacteria bacterium]|nr:nickel pincer cofactor biosynthesis protein LarC [Deltaproteobacteria bacterium]
MRIAYFDCFSGASGDMILGSMIDAGLSPGGLRGELKKLRLQNVSLKIKRVLRGGISATQVVVEGKDEKRHSRSLKDILQIIDRSHLESEVKEKSREVFEQIASVEAKIHRRHMEEIHFHEIGGLDSVVDIVGAIWGFREMGIEKLYVSRVNVGTGFVRCEHGLLPVPAPATLALMKGKPIYSSGVERELLTPTGAALLTSLGSEFGKMPVMEVERIGYGAGRDDLPHPNLLRLIVGKEEAVGGKEKVMVVETNIDDMNPQLYDYVMEKLLGMEVQEVFLTPILMKKNRPATLITVICSAEKLSSVIDFLIRETTTLGLRWREEERGCAEREIISLRTRYGRIHFKLARWDGRVSNLSPEYEDCKRLALKKGISLKEVFDVAKKAGTIFLEGRKKNQSSKRSKDGGNQLPSVP